MKKIKLLTGLSALTVLGVSSLPLTSCNKVQQFTVHFNTNGGSKIADIRVGKDSTIAKPVDPVKEGCEFLGWYSDEALTAEFDFNTKVTSDLTLYAKWIGAQVISKEEFLTLYTSYYNDFLSSQLKYKKEDLKFYINEQEMSITNVQYEIKGGYKQCLVSIKEDPTSRYILAGQTLEMIERIISFGTSNKMYKSENYIYLWIVSDAIEAAMVFNKKGYMPFAYELFPTTGIEITINVQFLNEPTK